MHVTHRLRMSRLGASVSCAALLAFGCAATPKSGTRTLDAVADTTIYAESGEKGNGSGPFLFVGNNGKAEPRRGLLAFDLAGGIPKGARITAVTLTMTMEHTASGASKLRLHRLTESWGEGAADAQGKGVGTAAAPDDATWTHRFHDRLAWSTAGGAFAGTASASVTSSTPGVVTWTSPGMVADAQGWLDRSDSNHGWAIVGEELDLPSAKRFCSRDNAEPASRPRLLVEYD